MYRAAPACRRPISLSGNCPNWYRRRFSSPRGPPGQERHRTSRIISCQGGRAPCGSELVADCRAQVVGLDSRVLDREEFDVFPFAPHEHIAPQHVFQTETAGPAGHEGIGSFFRQSLRLRRNEERSSSCRGRDAKGVCRGDIVAPRDETRHGARDIHSPNRDTAEYIRQEIAGCPTRARPECDRVLDLHRGAAGQGYSVGGGVVRSDLTARVDDLEGVETAGRSREPVEIAVVRFNTKDQIVPLIVAPDKGAKARALRRGFGQQSELRRRLLKHAVAKNEIRQTDDALAEIASYRRIAGLAAGVPAVPVSGDRRRGNTAAKVIGHV